MHLPRSLSSRLHFFLARFEACSREALFVWSSATAPYGLLWSLPDLLSRVRLEFRWEGLRLVPSTISGPQAGAEAGLLFEVPGDPLLFFFVAHSPHL